MIQIGKNDLIDFLIFPTLLLQFNYIFSEWKLSQSNALALYTIPDIKGWKICNSLLNVLFSSKNGWKNSKMVEEIYC